MWEPSHTNAYHRVPPRTTAYHAYHEGTRMLFCRPGTLGYPRVRPRTVAYRPAILLMLAEPFPRQQTHFFQDNRSRGCTSHRTGTRGQICTRSLQCSYLYQFRLASELAPSCPATHRTLAVFGVPSISHSILSSWGSHPTAIRKIMSTSSQGTSGPGGRAGFQPALERLPVSGHNPAPEQVLTRLEQTSTEQSISNDIKRLIVRTLADVFIFGANESLGDLRTLSGPRTR